MAAIVFQRVGNVHLGSFGGGAAVGGLGRTPPQDSTLALDVAEQGEMGKVGSKALPTPAFSVCPDADRRVLGSSVEYNQVAKERRHPGSLPLENPSLSRHS